MITRRNFLPREGFYIDPLAVLIRRILLNPKISVSVIIFLHMWNLLYQRTPVPKPLLLPPYFDTGLKLLSIIGTILDINDYLTHKVHNNWTTDDSWDWTQEIVLITGGSSGIGASVAQTLLLRNPKTRIVIIDHVPLTFAPPKRTSISFYQCDLSQDAEIRATCEKLKKEVGDPTVVFNNAGLTRGKSVMNGKYEDVQITLAVNLIAPFLVLKEFLPKMVERNHGHIIATS